MFEISIVCADNGPMHFNRQGFDWESEGRHFFIRDLEGDAELHEVENIQRDAWGFSDLDIVPHGTLVATQHTGGILLGAFDEAATMIGFAYAFPALEGGRVSVHSHMLAVRPEYRNARAGYYLKLAQRKRTIEMSVDEITWTFDPLQSLNAHLNFGKLGVISRRYIVNFYGEQTSSPLHQGFGTDRLWVSWLLESEHVSGRISEQSRHSNESLGAGESLVVQEGGRPRAVALNSLASMDRCLIEIPHDIPALKERDPGLATSWRLATREAFLSAIEAGFVVSDFQRLAGDRPRWCYVLSREVPR